MAYDRDGGGVWHTDFGKERLDADPATLRGYGENIGKLANNLKDEFERMELWGPAEEAKPTPISTGGFQPGVYADNLLTRNTLDHTYFLRDAVFSLRYGIPSAAFVLADVLEQMENANGARLKGLTVNAVDFAFGKSGARRPTGLPDYIGATLRDKYQDYYGEDKLVSVEHDNRMAGSEDSGTRIETYRTPNGGTRKVTIDGTGGEFHELYDADGVLLSTKMVRPDGSTTTTPYDRNGNPGNPTNTPPTTESSGDVPIHLGGYPGHTEGTVAMYETADGGTRVVKTYDSATLDRPYTEVEETFDKDGDRVSVRYTYPDGSALKTEFDAEGNPAETTRTRTVETPDCNGGVKRTEVTEVTDKNGEVTTTYKITNPDGSKEYYTVDANGNVTNSDSVGAQPESGSNVGSAADAQRQAKRVMKALPGG